MFDVECSGVNVNLKTKILILMLLFFASPALAVDWKSLRVDSKIQPPEGFLGDHLRLEIVIDHDKGVDLYYPEASYNLSPFEIIRIDVVEGSLDQNLQRTRLSYVIASYQALGEFVIPPLQIVAKDKGSGKKLITVQNHKVRLKKMIREENAELVDIYTPLEPEREIPVALLAYILCGILAAVAFVYLIIRFARRAATAGGAYTLDSREKAIQALRGLALDEAKKKLLYFQLSAIFRLFVEEHLRIPALKRTSAEILCDFERNHLLNGRRSKAGELFYDLDLVKFSSFEPSRPEMETAVRRTEQLIREMP